MLAPGPRAARSRGASLLAQAHLAAAAAYLGVLGASLAELTSQLRANSDVASVFLVGNSLAGGTAGRPIEAAQPAYVWLVAALDGLGHQQVVWTFLPLAMAWVGVAGVALAVARAGGRWAAGLAAAIAVAASPAVLVTEVAPAFHGLAWAVTGLVGWCVAALSGGRVGRRRSLGLGALTGALAGIVAASDALVIVVALIPAAVAGVVLAVRGRRPGWAAALIASSVVAFAAVHVYMAVAGYSTGLGGGTSRGLGLSSLAANGRVIGRGLLDMANGLPMAPGSAPNPAALAAATGFILLTVAAACVAGARRVRPLVNAPEDATRTAHVAYWMASAVLLVLAMLVSNVVVPGGDSPPADRLLSSERYIPGVFFAAAALVPLWPRAQRGRVIASALTAVFAALSSAQLAAAAANHDFQPAESRPLPLLEAALQSHGLSRGYASYWDADAIRLSSAGSLDVLSVAEGAQCGAGPGSFCRDVRNSAGGWFTPHPGTSFVVVDPADTFVPVPPPPSLGAPVDIFHVDRFTVYVYAGDVLQHFSASCAGRSDHRCNG